MHDIHIVNKCSNYFKKDTNHTELSFTFVLLLVILINIFNYVFNYYENNNN